VFPHSKAKVSPGRVLSTKVAGVRKLFSCPLVAQLLTAALNARLEMLTYAVRHKERCSLSKPLASPTRVTFQPYPMYRVATSSL